MSAAAVNWASPLKIHIAGTNDETVVRCYGRLTTEVIASFEDEVRKLLPISKCIVLDLRELKYMDSAGLGAVVAIYVSAKTAGCKLQLTNLSPLVYDLLCISNLISVFEDCTRHDTQIR